MNKKDYVGQIMDEWYESMATNNVSVQPKASTLLGMILSKYDVQLNRLLRKKGIFVGGDVYNTPCHQQPVFLKHVNKNLKLPLTNKN